MDKAEGQGKGGCEVTEQDFERSTILVVDDETLIRMTTAEILLNAGFKVLEACGAHEALAALEGRSDIALMLTDIEMPPGSDGIALASEVRDRWPDVAVVLCSGRVAPDDNEFVFLPKPFRAAELVAKVIAVLPAIDDRATDDEILEEWHAAELALEGAPDQATAAQRIMMAEQRAIERFGRGPHIAEYELRYPSGE